MRGRFVFIVLAALVVAAIAALNWPEFTQAQPLSFGVFTATVPVGVLMLSLMAIVLVAFLVTSAIQESRYLLDHRRHTRALNEQRTLADKAEASRFTDLRQQLDSHMRESRIGGVRDVRDVHDVRAEPVVVEPVPDRNRVRL